MLYQSEGLLLPLLHLLSRCLNCTHAQGQGKCRAGNSEKKKNQQKNRSSFWVFFKTHSRCIITREQGPPAHKNLRCVCTQSRGEPTHRSFFSCSTWHTWWAWEGGRCAWRSPGSRWRRTCHGYCLTPTWENLTWCQTKSAVRPSAWTAAAAVWIWPMAASPSRAERVTPVWEALRPPTSSDSSETSFTFRT